MDESIGASRALAPVVLIHGLIGPLADADLAYHLEPRAVLSLDLLGYGRSKHVAADRISIESQVQAVRSALDRHATKSRVHLIGHSVGWVIAAAFAHQHPERVSSLINVEGNFTLEDSFWSGQLAEMAADEVDQMLAAYRAAPAEWLAGMEIEPTSARVRAAAEALSFQPASTVQAMARAVVEYTGRPEYDGLLREVFSAASVHLVAGERSRAGWDVPEWALAEAASYSEIPSAGHMLMLEAPAAFRSTLIGLLSSKGAQLRRHR